jgi:hypothetical protein
MGLICRDASGRKRTQGQKTEKLTQTRFSPLLVNSFALIQQFFSGSGSPSNAIGLL